MAFTSYGQEGEKAQRIGADETQINDAKDLRLFDMDTAPCWPGYKPVIKEATDGFVHEQGATVLRKYTLFLAS